MQMKCRFQSMMYNEEEGHWVECWNERRECPYWYAAETECAQYERPCMWLPDDY